MVKFVNRLQKMVSDLRKGRRASPNMRRVVAEDVPKALAVMPVGPARGSLQEMFDGLGWRLVFADTPAAGIAHSHDAAFPVILYERELTGRDWRLTVSLFAKLSPQPSVILLSAGADRNLWDEVIRCGGCDILRMPLDQDAVMRAVKAGWFLWRNQQNLRQPITPLRTA